MHMNGRVFDPVLGRFLSADPNIQDAGNLQSYNRYSYVLNNPLAFTDPSGYFSLKKLFKAAVTIWAVAIAGPAIFEAVLPSAVNAVGAMGVGMGGSIWGGSLIAGAISGAAVGGILGGLNGGWDGALQGAKFGAIGGAVMGPISKLYGSNWNWERVLVQSVGGGISSELTGGNFRDGLRGSFAINLAMLGWSYARDITDSLKQKSCDLLGSICVRNRWGELLTDGTRDIESECGKNSTCWGSNFITKTGMGTEGGGLLSATNPGGHSYNENGYFGRFINQVSKVHDFFNSPGYNWDTGAWISRGPVYDTLFQLYSFSGMLPAGLVTGYAHGFSQNPELLRVAR